jgi:gas vesicle protein
MYTEGEEAMEQDNRISYFFLGLGIGVACGILFAPNSGEETRRAIRSKAEESKDYLRRKGDELRESTNELVDRGRSALQRQKDQLSAAVEAGRQAYRETVSGTQAQNPGDAGVGV